MNIENRILQQFKVKQIPSLEDVPVVIDNNQYCKESLKAMVSECVDQLTNECIHQDYFLQGKEQYSTKELERKYRNQVEAWTILKMHDYHTVEVRKIVPCYEALTVWREEVGISRRSQQKWNRRRNA